MSYEYMQGLGAVGDLRFGKTRETIAKKRGEFAAMQQIGKVEAACASADCTGKPKFRIIGGKLPDAADRSAFYQSQGCSVCSSDGDIYMCCPDKVGAYTKAPTPAAPQPADVTVDPGMDVTVDPGMDVMVDPGIDFMNLPEDMPPVDDTDGGFPWGGAIAGLLLLGGAAFAGYWFLLRDGEEEAAEGENE